MKHSTTPSSAPFIATRPAFSRRQFLRGAGVALTLPFLEAMRPTFARASSSAPKPRRMLGICNNLGLVPEFFFPTETGRGYALSPYLDHLREHREDFTVFSGVWHPDVDGGHFSVRQILRHTSLPPSFNKRAGLRSFAFPPAFPLRPLRPLRFEPKGLGV